MPTLTETSPPPAVETIVVKKNKTKTDPKPNPALVELLESYDESAQQTQSIYIDIIEFAQKENLSRSVVVLSIQQARKCSYETANTQYSKFFGIAKDPAVLDALKSGNITLKVARELTTKAQKRTVEAKDPKVVYDKALQSFVEAAKATGEPIEVILVSVKAALKAAEIK